MNKERKSTTVLFIMFVLRNRILNYYSFKLVVLEDSGGTTGGLLVFSASCNRRSTSESR